MDKPVFKPRLPTFGNTDGDQVVDQNDNQYEYNSELNEWVFMGQIASPDVVTEDEDGLVSPDIFRKLILIQDLMKRGIDFSRFKLDSPVENPYYYLFHSSDDLIRFTPEKNNEPKELKLISSITSLETVNDTTVLGLENIDSLTVGEAAGLVLETDFGNFNILSNTATSIVVAGSETSIRVNDRVKIVKPEVFKTELRIEVDRGRLYQKMIRNCCVGPKGLEGDVGDAGSAGDADVDEVFELPLSTTDDTFRWSSIVDTPIGTPISLRVFRQDNDDDVIIEIVFPIDGGPVLIIVSGDEIDIEVTSSDVTYSATSRVFEGFIVVTSGGDDIDTWRYKVRQVGPTGADGEDGLSFIEVAAEILDDPSLRGTEAIISLRKSSVSDDIIFLNGTLFEEIPTSNLGALDGGSISDVEKDLFVSAEVTINEARDVAFYNFLIPDVPVPPLDLPAWTPTRDCVQARRWALYKYDWFNRVEPNYLYNISLPPKPDEACCQEDFFFCPNVGDEPCAIEGKPDSPTPIPTPCICDCENPIADQFGDEGFIMPPIDLTDPSNAFTSSDDIIISPESVDPNASEVLEDQPGGQDVVVEDSFVDDEDVKASAIGTIESVVDGTINRFIQDITGTGNIQIDVSLDYDSDICGGEVEERKSCAYVDPQAFRAMFTLESLTGDAAITSPTMAETRVIPTSVTFTASTEKNVLPDVPPETQPGEIAIPVEEGNVPSQVENPEFETANHAVSTFRLTIIANTTEVDYCSGYRLTITTKSDRIDPKQERTFIITTPNSILIPVTSDVTNVTNGSESFSGSSSSSSSVISSSSLSPSLMALAMPGGSFAPDGSVISGGVTPDEMIVKSSYALSFDIARHKFSATGDPNFFYDPEDHGIGELINSPSWSQVPLIFDHIHNNCVISIPRFTINKNDSAFDVNGPWGSGTYLLGSDFATSWSSRIPFTNMRTDSWTDTVVFFGEPEVEGGPFFVTITARLASSVLHDSASSVFGESLFNSNISDGILVINGHLQEDPLTIIDSGSITFSESGSVALTYTDDISELYPTIMIDLLPGTGGT